MTRLTILPAYTPAYQSKKRYKRLQGGGGSGKSIAVAKIILARTMMKSGSRAYCFRKVGRTVRNSIFATFYDLIQDHDIFHLFEISRTLFTFRFVPTGSEIICSGLDESEKIKSIKDPTIIWMEEATEFIEDDFLQLDLRLRKPKTQLEFFLTYNPISKTNWVFSTFELSNAYRADEYFLNTTYKNNPYLPTDYVKMLDRLKGKSENHFKVYALGEWGEITKGLVFPEFEVVDNPPPIQPIYGLDFGFNDPMALVRVWLNDPDLYLEELYFESGQTIPDLIQALPALGVGKNDLIYYDSARPGDGRQIENAGYRVKPSQKGAGSIENGISKMKGYNLKVLGNSANLIKELGKYRWDEDKEGNLIDGRPIDAFNHAIDAARYACYTHTFQPQPMPAAKARPYHIKRAYKR